MALELDKTKKAGILIRLRDNSVFYVPLEDLLLNYKLPDSLQAGGFTPSEDATPVMQPTGDNFQEILNGDDYLRKTNLMNAQLCKDGVFQMEAGSNKIRLVSGSKGNKPIHRF
jgi:hypothetical protein